MEKNSKPTLTAFVIKMFIALISSVNISITNTVSIDSLKKKIRLNGKKNNQVEVSTDRIWVGYRGAILQPELDSIICTIAKTLLFLDISNFVVI